MLHIGVTCKNGKHSVRTQHEVKTFPKKHTREN